MKAHTWLQARQAIYEQGQLRQGQQELELAQSLGAVLAQDLQAPIALPHYDSSAMDGYAVCGPGPWLLLDPPPAEEDQNIHRLARDLKPGYASPILTGGLLPAGTQAILRQERAKLSPKDGLTWLEALGPEPAAGSDIRRAAEELACGSTIARAGQDLTPRLLAFLAVCGISTLVAYSRQRLSVAYTGNEVITRGLPGPGQVRDAYSIPFPAILSSYGAELASTARLRDSQQQVLAWVRSSDTASSQLLLVTGGSSTSRVDVLRQTLKQLGATYIFSSVAVRPGHPCLCAQLPDGRLLLGLPGNPLAAYTSLYSYLPAYLAGACGQALPALKKYQLAGDIPALKSEDQRIIPGLRDGLYVIPLLNRSKSHMLSDFAQAQLLLLLPPQGAQAGQDILTLELRF
ncbi:MAG: molybdopterin-binding protein [Rothia sp. (in: high G+C Gram-positive bacteria)]|nr:molybdopterin-binding protein [Rothia sp. (in: high G+C Gram-positive bacteria)]